MRYRLAAVKDLWAYAERFKRRDSEESITLLADLAMVCATSLAVSIRRSSRKAGFDFTALPI